MISLKNPPSRFYSFLSPSLFNIHFISMNILLQIFFCKWKATKKYKKPVPETVSAILVLKLWFTKCSTVLYKNMCSENCPVEHLCQWPGEGDGALAHEVCRWPQAGVGTSQYMQGQGCRPAGPSQGGRMGQQERGDARQRPGREAVMQRDCMSSCFELRVAFLNFPWSLYKMSAWLSTVKLKNKPQIMNI